MSPSRPCPRCREREVASSGYCRPCSAAKSKEWRTKNPERWRELEHTPERREYRRAWKINDRYGLIVEEYDALIASGCAICGTTEGQIVLDHDHATGKAREALCAGCNKGLGAFADDPQRLAVAIEYLEAHCVQTSPA